MCYSPFCSKQNSTILNGIKIMIQKLLQLQWFSHKITEKLDYQNKHSPTNLNIIIVLLWTLNKWYNTSSTTTAVQTKVKKWLQLLWFYPPLTNDMGHWQANERSVTLLKLLTLSGYTSVLWVIIEQTSRDMSRASCNTRS